MGTFRPRIFENCARPDGGPPSAPPKRHVLVPFWLLIAGSVCAFGWAAMALWLWQSGAIALSVHVSITIISFVAFSAVQLLPAEHVAEGGQQNLSGGARGPDYLTLAKPITR